MAFNYAKLKGLIVEKYGTISNFSESNGLCVQTVSAKLNNKIGVTKNDIMEWSAALGITLPEIGIYFFTLKV